MGPLSLPEMFAIFVVAILLFAGKNWRDVYARLYEELENFRNFRGGPGSPSHPIPANDSYLLNRRRRLDEHSGIRRKR
jgi:hypothetical protein